MAIVVKTFKIMKIYLTALLSFLIAPALAFAALDVTMSGSSVISVGGYNLVVSGTANFDSIEVGASSFSVQLSPAATLTVTSSDRKTLTVSPTQYTTSQTCNASESSVTVAMAAGGTATTVTITPSSDTCASIGGSGGGGGTSIRPVASSSSSVSSANVAQVIPAPSVANPSSIARSVSPVFNRNLARGSKGEDVSNLQKLLAQDKTIYPEGIISGVFGPMTEMAVKKFQAKYKLPQIGVVGPATRQMLQIVASVNPSATAQQSSTSSTPSLKSSNVYSSAKSINKRLEKGMTNEQVSTLQQWLSQDKEIYPNAIVSGYFGSLTEKAVQKFQEKYGIAGPGEEGYGAVGPKTRAKLSEIFGGSASSSQ